VRKGGRKKRFRWVPLKENLGREKAVLGIEKTLRNLRNKLGAKNTDALQHKKREREKNKKPGTPCLRGKPLFFAPE